MSYSLTIEGFNELSAKEEYLVNGGYDNATGVRMIIGTTLVSWAPWVGVAVGTVTAGPGVMVGFGMASLGFTILGNALG